MINNQTQAKVLENILTKKINELTQFVENNKDLKNALKIRFNAEKKMVELRHFFTRVQVTPIRNFTAHQNILGQIEDLVECINFNVITCGENDIISNLDAETIKQMAKFSKKSLVYNEYFLKQISYSRLVYIVNNLLTSYEVKFDECSTKLYEIANLVDDIVNITRGDVPEIASKFENSEIVKLIAYEKGAKDEVAKEILNKSENIK